MVASFTNFDDKSVELQIRGKLLNSNGKIALDDQPVARFEGGILDPIAGQPGKFDTVSKMIIAPLGTFILSVCSTVAISYLRRGISRCCHGCDPLGVYARHF